MTEKTELIHDLSVIRHLSKKIDLSDKEQVRAVLLLQRDDGLFKTGYGKRFIARLIDYFTDKPAKIPNKFVHHIDPNKCVKCGSCIAGCHFGAIIKR